MASPRNRRHILVAQPPRAEAFTTRRRGRPKAFRRPANPEEHAHHLTVALNRALEQGAIAQRQLAQAEQGKAGILVAFRAPESVELNLKSLDNKHAGIEVRSVTQVVGPDEQTFTETATVFIPEESVSHFHGKFQQYATQETKKGHPKNRDLVDRIAAIDLAPLRVLWTDRPEDFPTDDTPIWWEVWLQSDGDGHEIQRLETFARQADIRVGARHLTLHDRTVCLVLATAQQLHASLSVLGDLAELRKAKPASGFFLDLTPTEQGLWADDVIARLTPPGGDAPAVCPARYWRDPGPSSDCPRIGRRRRDCRGRRLGFSRQRRRSRTGRARNRDGRPRTLWGSRTLCWSPPVRLFSGIGSSR